MGEGRIWIHNPFGISTPETRAFLYSGGQMTDLGTLPGGDTSSAKVINNSGQVAGTATTDKQIPGVTEANGNPVFETHGFLYRDGQMSELAPLAGHNDLYVEDMNDSGQVVGDSGVAYSGDRRAFVYQDGRTVDLNSLLPAGSGYTAASGYTEGLYAYDINNKGQILATASDANFYSDNPEFVMTPAAPDSTAPTMPPPAADTTKPTITPVSPRHASITRDTTPLIRATVKDNNSLAKANVKLYVGGRLISGAKYSYAPSTGALVHNSPRLAKGKKTVKIVATDAAGNVSIKSWYFTIK